MRIFISFEGKDSRFVHKLATRLNKIGHECVMTNLQTLLGNAIFTELDRGLQNSDYVMIILSKSYLTIDWMQKELAAFVAKEKQDESFIVLPVLIEKAEIPALLSDKGYADFTRSFDEGFSQLTSLITNEQQVFVIMKFGDRELDSAYKGVVKPIIEQFNLTAVRIDEIEDSGKISDQILNQIRKSKIVLADLTGERPNCYYEAGFAHAMNKELILTARSGTYVHFDLSHRRFITWDTEDDLRTKLRRRFEALKCHAK